MRKTKFLFSAMLAIALCGLTACSSDEHIEPEVIEDVQLTKDDVANILKSIEIDAALSKEIHQGVTNALNLGFDEEVGFKTLLSNDEKTRGVASSLLMERLNAAASGLSTRNGYMPLSINNSTIAALEESDYMIYWPYSEEWNGEDLPTIVVAPEDEDADEAEGIRITEKGIYETVIVNEDYMLKHPVWVITKEQKTDAVIIPGAAVEAEREFKTRAANTLYVWLLDHMQVLHQYDGPFAGGSEIDVQVVFPALQGYAAINNKFRLNFSRSDISKGRSKAINQILNTNWRPEQITNGMVITESDGGSNVTKTIAVTAKIENTPISITTTYTIQDGDDEIASMPLDRDYMMAHGFFAFDGNNVRMEMPVIIE